MGAYLDKLRAGGKWVFLLTNSPYRFVDCGMTYLLKDHLESTGDVFPHLQSDPPFLFLWSRVVLGSSLRHAVQCQLGILIQQNTLKPGKEHWTDLFDAIICSARKPDFYVLAFAFTACSSSRT